MKHQILIILLVACCNFGSVDLFSQKIYLSPAGSDSNPGTIDKPLASLPMARDIGKKNPL